MTQARAVTVEGKNHISPNEIRDRALRFVNHYSHGRRSEMGDSQTFWNAFFDIFGIRRESVAVFERRAGRGGSRGRMDLLWPGVLMVEQKSPGKSLDEAMEQAEDYFLSLSEDERPRYMLACNFEDFLLVNLTDRTEYGFSLKNLVDNLDRFEFMNGIDKKPHEEYHLSIRASKIMAGIYINLKNTGYGGEGAGYLLTRLAYCMFADDTGIFERRNMLYDYIENRTADDGSDLGPKLIELFQVLDTPVEKRQHTMDDDLKKFPYVDGGLFEKRIDIPSMDAGTRSMIIEASKFDWNGVSPAIFGNLFQGVMDSDERHDTGSHYTIESNIRKVIRPLFMDGLWAEFERIRSKQVAGRERLLEKFRAKLASLKFLDPACGSGNFLIVSYKELRRLELETILEIHDPRTKRFDPAGMLKVNVDQFYGIELNEFSARIAETAMWMMDHLMNNEVSRIYGESYTRIPLKHSANIMCADALETDWQKILPAEKCSYILGNPPFGGSKVTSEEQRKQVRDIASLGKSGGTLDYVTAWFIKASRHSNNGGGGGGGDAGARIGLVSTNSITQGEQVGQLWPIIFDEYGMEIAYAHQTFPWDSDAVGKAHVHVVIIGLAKKDTVKQKRLFVDGGEENPKYISPYLTGFDKKIPFVSESSSLNNLPKMVMGSKPIDDGNYIFKDGEKKEFLEQEPGVAKFINPYVGAKDFINGKKRWILALHDAEPSELRVMPRVMERINAVRKYRLNSRSAGTQKLAEHPRSYHLNVIPSKPFLLIPRVSSERRKYIPIGYVEPPSIPGDSTMIIYDATFGLFGLLTSRLHMVWMSRVGGRLESRYRYSAGLVYNTFPLPRGGFDTLNKLEPYAKAVLKVRENHPGQTLADLYDPDVMPGDLLKAHQKLDSEVDRIYRKKKFDTDNERFEFLLKMYAKMIKKNNIPKKSNHQGLLRLSNF